MCLKCLWVYSRSSTQKDQMSFRVVNHVNSSSLWVQAAGTPSGSWWGERSRMTVLIYDWLVILLWFVLFFFLLESCCQQGEALPGVFVDVITVSVCPRQVMKVRRCLDDVWPSLLAVSRGCRVVESISRVRNRKASVLTAAWRQDARLPVSTQVNTPLHFLLSLQFYFHSSFLLLFFYISNFSSFNRLCSSAARIILRKMFLLVLKDFNFHGCFSCVMTTGLTCPSSAHRSIFHSCPSLWNGAAYKNVCNCWTFVLKLWSWRSEL